MLPWHDPHLASGWLLRPRLTSRSASRRCPFRHQARPPQVRLRDLPRTTAGSTRWLFGRYGFAVTCPLALTHHALYPVPVRRLAGLLHASSRPHLAVTPLRFASVRCGLLAQRTLTSKSRAMLGAHVRKRRRFRAAALLRIPNALLSSASTSRARSVSRIW